MPAATKKAMQAALKTFFAIRQFVDLYPFTPTGLAKGLKSLGRTLEQIEADVRWLKEQGFIAEVTGSTKLIITQKGRYVEDPESSDSSEDEIVSTPIHKDEESEDEDSPDEEDGADSFEDLRSLRE